MCTQYIAFFVFLSLNAPPLDGAYSVAVMAMSQAYCEEVRCRRCIYKSFCTEYWKVWCQGKDERRADKKLRKLARRAERRNARNMESPTEVLELRGDQAVCAQNTDLLVEEPKRSDFEGGEVPTEGPDLASVIEPETIDESFCEKIRDMFCDLWDCFYGD